MAEHLERLQPLTVAGHPPSAPPVGGWAGLQTHGSPPQLTTSPNRPPTPIGGGAS